MNQRFVFYHLAFILIFFVVIAHYSFTFCFLLKTKNLFFLIDQLMAKRRNFLDIAGAGFMTSGILSATVVDSSQGLFSGRPYPPASEHNALRARAAVERKMDPRPNILVLLTDQQTLKALSCAGNSWLYTPHLDALATQSVRFERSYCTSPVCTPSRASLFTGLMPHQAGATYLDQPLKPGVRTVGERLEEAGYDTTYIGQWHLPVSLPKRTDAIPGFVYLPLPADIKEDHLGEITDGIHATDAKYYLRWHAALSPKPWFLAVSLLNPHDICYYCVNKTLPHPEGAMLPPLPDNFAISENEPEMLRWRRDQLDYTREMPYTKAWAEEDWRSYLYAYYRWVETADRACGSILQSLKDGGWWDNTLIIFTSDHGEGVAAHHWVTKLSLYEEPLSVPFLVKLPAATKGRVDQKSLVSGIDVTPTILDYAGVKEDPGLTGKSLRPVLENPDAHLRDYVFAEMAVNKNQPDWHARMVSDGHYKYIAYSKGERPEQLFDLKSDPGETVNLADDDTCHEIKKRFQGALDEWLEKTQDPFKRCARQ